MSLTDPDFIKKLETLYLLARKVLGGDLKADRKSQRKGAGIIFSDYSEYVFGDDYRSIDWTIYARLEQLVVKLFELEEDVPVFLLLDISRSMEAKLDYAKQLTAALGYIALNNLDKLAVYGITENLTPLFQLGHGRARSIPFLRTLNDVSCAGSDTDFTQSLRQFQSRYKRAGICVLISDFFTPHGYEEGLKFLRWAKHDVYCLQVLDPLEMTCDWRGDVEMECVETHARRRITVSPREVERYEIALREWNQALERECGRRKIGFARTTTEIPFEHVIQTILRRGGLIA